MAKSHFIKDSDLKSEAGVKDDTKRWLNAHLVFDTYELARSKPPIVLGFFYMPVQNGMGLTGVPDFSICFMGRFVVAESKAENKPPKPTALQRSFIEATKRAGGVGFTFNSLTMFIKQWVEVVDTKHYLRWPNEKQ